MQIVKNLCQINPIVYSVNLFDYKRGANTFTKIENFKSQYSYRFICVTDGKVNFEIDGELYECKKGSVVFLVPSSVYRILPCDENFSFTHVFFDFFDQGVVSDKKTSCVFMDNFNPLVPTCRVNFSNAKSFNQSCVFFGENYVEIFNKILVAFDGDFGALMVKGLLIRFVLSLVKEQVVQKPNSVGQEIVNYIKVNAKTVCAQGLQNHFGYHKNYINRLVKDCSGSNLGDLIRRVKIERAKEMILELGLPPTSVAIELGYYDYSHFFKAFKQETGVTPTEFLGV